MKAIYVKEPKSLEIVELPAPSPGDDEILVRVRASGICGSDMHIYHGTNPLAEYPRISIEELTEKILSMFGNEAPDDMSADIIMLCAEAAETEGLITRDADGRFSPHGGE